MGFIEDHIKSQKIQKSSLMEDLLGGVESGFVGDVPTSSVFTKEHMEDQTDPASMGTHFKAGFVDDPETQIKIYASSRFPDDPGAINRYGVHNGEIVYIDDDGKLYRETPDTWWEGLKRFAAKTGAHLPSILLSTIGASAGPGTAALGAAGGEGIRKSLGATVFDEPQTAVENIKSMGGEAALAVGGEMAGRGIARGAKYLGAKRGGRLAAQAGRGREFIDPTATAQLERTGRAFGIDLYPPQTTGSKTLADKFNLLGDIESSAPIIQAARKKQVEQIDDAVYRFLDDISPSETPLKTGEKLVEASKKAVETPVKIRQAKASPLYRKAFQRSKPVDTEPVIKEISDLMTDLPEGRTAQRGVLNKIKRMLQKEVTENGETKLIPQGSLKVLDNAKKAIDKLLDGPEGAAIEKDLKRRLTIIKDNLVSRMDRSNPLYKKARKIFEDYSQEVTRQGKKTIVSNLSKLENDQVVNASRRLFKDIATSPETMARAKKLIKQQDPKAWNGALRAYLQELFESTKQSARGDISNIGGHFYKKVWGDIRQRKILQAAMDSKQFGTLEKFMTVLERSGMILGRESATATRQVALEEIGGGQILKRGIRAATRPLYTKERLLGDKLLESVLHRNARKLAEAMTSERAARQLEQIMKVGEKPTKLLPQITTFLTMVGSGVFNDAGKDRIPSVIRKPGRDRSRPQTNR